MGSVTPSQSNPGDLVTAASINTPINQLATVINGGIDSTNITDGGIATVDLGDDIVNAQKMVNGVVYRRQGGDANNWYTAGTTTFDLSATDVKLQCGTIAITADPTIVTFPVAYTNPPVVIAMQTKVSGGNAFIRASNITNTAVSLSAILDTGVASTAQTASWIAIGI